VARRGNKEGTITKLKNGRYMGKIQLGRKPDGKPNRISVYGKTRGEVSEKLITIAHQAIEGSYNIQKGITLGEWIKRWLRDYKAINLKPRTYDTYETQIQTHIIPSIGNIKLKDLKTAQLQQFINTKYQSGKGLSPATLRKIYNIVNAALKQAQLNDLIIKNPAEGVELPRLKQKSIRAFTAEEQNQFLSAARNMDMYPAFLIALNTGLRMGELLALTWNDIDFKNRTINVDKNIMVVRNREKTAKTNYKIIVQDTPKTDASTRKIPMTEKVMITFIEQKLKCMPGCDLVFPSRKNTLITPRNFERSFVTAAKKAGIYDCNTHTMRHTFATRCFEKGIPIKIVSKWLGHSKVSHTLDIYTHIMSVLENEAIKMLEKPEKSESETGDFTTHFTTHLR
jgi:integrase